MKRSKLPQKAEKKEALGDDLQISLVIEHEIQEKQKLFCNCPAKAFSSKQKKIKSLSFDWPSKIHKTNSKHSYQETIYYHYTKNTCTYEHAEQPPGILNQEALRIAVEVAMLCDAVLPESFHVTRQLVQHSALPPSGYLRSLLVGIGGNIRVGDKLVPLKKLVLAESECQELPGKSSQKHFVLDSFGRATIQLQSEWCPLSPEEGGQLAQNIQDLLIATGKVICDPKWTKIQIKIKKQGNPPILLKGKVDIKEIPDIIERECIRQNTREGYIKKGIQLGIYADKYRKSIRHQKVFPGDTHFHQKTKLLPKDLCGIFVVLPQLQPLLLTELQPDLLLLEELHALFSLHCIYPPTSIETDLSALNEKDNAFWQQARETLHCDTDDALLFITGKESVLHQALQIFKTKLSQLWKGVEEETRELQKNGSSCLIEPLIQRYKGLEPSCPAYPLPTDLPSAESLVKGPNWRRQWLLMALPKDMIDGLIRTGRVGLFERIRSVNPKVPAKRWGELLYCWPRKLQKKGYPIHQLSETRFMAIASLYAMNRCSREALPDLIALSALFPDHSVKQLLQRMGISPWNPKKLRESMPQLLAGPLPKKTDWSSRQRFWLGRIMEQIRGSISGAIVRKELYRYFSENPPTPYDQCEFPPPKKELPKKKRSQMRSRKKKR